MEQDSGIPGTEEFLKIVNSPDDLTIVVRGHQCVEAALNAALSERLSVPHALEISRLSFALKIDLAIALGVMPADSRPAQMKLNALRNQFAHDRQMRLTEEKARELYHGLSARLRHILNRKHEEMGDVQDVVREIIAVLFTELEVTVRELREQKLRDEVLIEMVNEKLSPYRARIPDLGKEVQKEIEERLERRKQGLAEHREAVDEGDC